MRINMTTFRPHESFAIRATGNMNARLNKLYQAAAARMFYIWGEVSDHHARFHCKEHFDGTDHLYIGCFVKALSSQLESILDNEQKQMNLDNNNESGGGAGATANNFWNSDESYDDYYNEGTHACNFVLHVNVVESSMSVFSCLCRSVDVSRCLQNRGENPRLLL